MIVLTKIQAWVVEAIRQGYSERQITAISECRSDTYHTHKHALRRKGAISKGTKGVAGSVKVLIAGENQPGGYMIDPKSVDHQYKLTGEPRGKPQTATVKRLAIRSRRTKTEAEYIANMIAGQRAS